MSTVESDTTSGSLPPAETALPRALEVFAGAGGMALGMHRAGFEIADLIEINEASCATLRANADRLGFKEPGQIEAQDAATVSWSKYAGVDLLCAGAPCQPFSRGGHSKGRNDERNMLGEVVKAVALVRPRAFVVENVRGLLFDSQVGYLKSIVARLRNPTVEDPSTKGSEDVYWARAPAPSEEDLYTVQYQLLDAADFGLPQRRPRLFIVGIDQDHADAFVWPIGGFSRERLIDDLAGDAYWRDHPAVSKAARQRARAGLPKAALERVEQPQLKLPDPSGPPRWRTLRDLQVKLGPPTPPERTPDDRSHVLVRGARLYGKHTGSRIDWVAKTVKAGVHGSPGGEHIVVRSAGRFRYLSVRECAHLQGFPADFELPELRTPAMKQLGNAVPVAVASALGVKLLAALDHQ